MNIVDENNEPTKEFFVFLKYNKVQSETKQLNDRDEILFKEFKTKWKSILQALKEDNDDVKSLFGVIMTMFGYNRHYCSMTGVPIIGRYYKIGGKIVCEEAYEAHRIIQNLEKREDQVNEKKRTKRPKTS